MCGLTRRMTRTKKWLVGLVALAPFALVGAREAGFVEFHSYVTVSRAEHVSHLTRSEALSVRLAERSSESGQAVVTRTHREGQRFEVIRTQGEDSIVLTANLEPLELSGPYWLPLIKKGSCSWRAEVEGMDGELSGAIHGTIEFTLKGTCSLRHLQEWLMDQALDSVSESLEGELE